jgi:hypothetical protein
VHSVCIERQDYSTRTRGGQPEKSLPEPLPSPEQKGNYLQALCDSQDFSKGASSGAGWRQRIKLTLESIPWHQKLKLSGRQL